MPSLSALYDKFIRNAGLTSGEQASIRTHIAAQAADDDLTAYANAANAAARRTLIGAGDATLNTFQVIQAEKQFAATATFSNEVHMQNNVFFTGSMYFEGADFEYMPSSAAAHRAALGIPNYDNLAAANAALNVGDVYYDTALGKLRTATA